ncbi:MAG: ferric reductase-like transmembrane domain-containing protein [Hyphomonas sp.]|nr:ferric reductase-like transmembrane domain-containing protein [Hyphomonas sp.]
MAHGYKAVTWTPFKKRFDAWMLAGVAVYLTGFSAASSLATTDGESFTPVQMLIRATGTLAFLMLTFILCIGPMARLTPRFKPLLYNRRHLGVTTFLIALVHAGLVTLWYHGFSDINPIVSLLVSNPRYDSISGFPFESLGLIALLILFLMAATSHDFWNANLGPGLWKAVHMSVYGAYVLLVAHVALGAIQFEKHPAYVVLLASGAAIVTALQLYSAFFASGPDAKTRPTDGWLEVGSAADIPDSRAIILEPEGAERIAVFRNGNKVHAVSNVCRHQGGPLGEGRIIDGCITCPWHGFQYRPEDGRSPEPFTERISTYETQIRDGIIYVNPRPLAPGTPVTPSLIEEAVR